MTQTIQSYIGGRWQGAEAAPALRSAIDGKTISHTHAESIDFAEAVEHARRKGLPALMALDFQERALRLKALAKYLMEHKEQLYAVSAHTGAIWFTKAQRSRWVKREDSPAPMCSYLAEVLQCISMRSIFRFGDS